MRRPMRNVDVMCARLFACTVVLRWRAPTGPPVFGSPLDRTSHRLGHSNKLCLHEKLVVSTGRYSSASSASAANQLPSKDSGSISGTVQRFWTSYTRAVDQKPLLTKAITSAVLAAAGDVLAQLVASKNGELDVVRILRFAAVNGILVGPTFHFWYGSLSKLVPWGGFSGAMVRMVPDQLVFSPAFLFVFLSVVRTAATPLEGLQPPSRDLWWTANCINWSVLPITQLMNFWLIPLNLQVLFSNFIAVGMSAVMSFLAASS